MIVSFFGVNLARAERLSDRLGRFVFIDVSMGSLVSAQVELVSGTWGTAVVSIRKANRFGATGVDYTSAVTLSAPGMTSLQVCESEYIQAETSVGNTTDLFVNIHFHLRTTTGVVA